MHVLDFLFLSGSFPIQLGKRYLKVVLFLVSKVQLQALFLYISLKSNNKKINFPKGSFMLDAMLSRSITTASLQHCF